MPMLNFCSRSNTLGLERKRGVRTMPRTPYFLLIPGSILALYFREPSLLPLNSILFLTNPMQNRYFPFTFQVWQTVGKYPILLRGL